MDLDKDARNEFERDYMKAWRLAVEAIRLEEEERLQEASRNYVVSAGILCILLGKTSDPELRNSIRPSVSSTGRERNF
ncbi:MAG: hypothetical protein ACTSSA_02940 [Candidatus Freyarchaeota archaeon]